MTSFYKEFTFIMLCACVLAASVITALQYGAEASYKERRVYIMNFRYDSRVVIGNSQLSETTRSFGRYIKNLHK